MTDLFTADFFTGNRDRLQAEIKAKLTVIAANGLLQRSADTTFPFRQDSNFWYLTGVEEPDFLLIISGERTFLIAPKRDDHRDQWDGAIDKKLIKQKSGIDDVYEHYDGWSKLDQLIKTYKKVHTITPAEAYLDHFGFYANPARGALLSALTKHKKLEMVDIRKQIARLRQVKQGPEIEALRQAIGITAAALNLVSKKIKSYKYEYEVSADITREFLRLGATGHAYQPIIAGGRNAATIHYVDNNQPLESGELLLLDVGAEVSNYSADITRTYATGRSTKRQRDVAAAVRRVHKEALRLLKPGVDMRTYEQQIDAFMAVQLKGLGLLEDVTDKRRLKKYYPHLASHFLGLDTHDAADYNRPLEPGMVLTVEPGIYIPEENIGIRIEDNILITKTGNEVLSAALPSRLDCNTIESK